MVLALLAATLGTAFLWAQPTDTPIVIGDGSLTMASVGVPWSSFTGSGATHGHPNANKSVTSIDVAMPAMSNTVTFNPGEQAEVHVTYAGTFDIDVFTGPSGNKLAVKTDFTQFHAADANHLAQNNATGIITHVTILRAGTVAFDSAASGHTVVTVHYK
jgi:hypothetical protein